VLQEECLTPLPAVGNAVSFSFYSGPDRGLAMKYRIQHLKLGGILDQAVAITKDHFGLLFTIMLLLFVPANLIFGFIQLAMLPEVPTIMSSPEQHAAFRQAALQNVPINLLFGLLIGLVITPLTNAAVVDAVARLYLGQPTTAVDSLKHGLSRLLPLIGTSILMGLAIMGGFILLIIPGILFALWFALSTHVVVIERLSGAKALGRSKELVRPHLGTMIVLGLLLLGVSFGLGMVAGFIPQAHLQLVVQTLVTAVTTVFFTAAFVVFYFSCRCAVDNFDLQHLAESIGVEADAEQPADVWINEDAPPSPAGA
jgi:hypothetical protein